MSDGFYDFIEIGTSDFDTLIEKATDEMKGISIDPLQHFLDRLPNPKNCTKVCAAILDERGEIDLHYIKDEDIVKYNLPYFVRGSASLGRRHPFILTLLANEAADNPIPEPIDPDEIYSKKKVPVKRLKDIIDEYYPLYKEAPPITDKRKNETSWTYYKKILNGEVSNPVKK